MTGYLVGFLIRGELHGLGLLSVNKPFLAACASVHVAPLVSQIARVLKKNDGGFYHDIRGVQTKGSWIYREGRDF